MFAATTTRKTTSKKRSTSRKRSSSRKKSPRRPMGEITGYSCTLYRDYLVFFGGFYAGSAINDAFVYNLKEGRMNGSQRAMKNLYCPKFNHAALYNERQNQILFMGGESEERRYGDEHPNSVLQFIEKDGVVWHLAPGEDGPYMPSPVCGFYEKKLYAYQASQGNGNFGEFRSYDIDQRRWRELRTTTGNMRLRHPSQKAIFVQNKLYVFTENVDEKPRGVPRGAEFIEDVYVLAISESERNRPEWERAFSSGQVPGLMSNISMAEDNEVIYVFGLNHEGEKEPKSVLWAFDTNVEKWRRIQDIGTLTARPNQRAVIYKGQLLIIDWDYENQTVEIQYQNLDKINFAPLSTNNKDLCKDKPESFIQEFKNLYEGRLFSDVVFEVEGEEIPAHKALLAYRSNYFMKVFTSKEGDLLEGKYLNLNK